jgi:ketosteroid isomerase-like protein
MATSKVDKVRDYFRRQYEREEGGVEENIRALFADNATLQLTDGTPVALEDVINSATMLRKIPKSERVMEVSDLREEGDTVAFHSRVRFRHPETGEWTEMSSDALWRFNGQGKIVESKSSASIVEAM